MTLLDLVFPKQCVSCGKFGRYICERCQKQIIPIAQNECICPMCEKPAIAGVTHPRCHSRYALDGLTSFFYYKDVVKKLITSIKYGYVRDMANELVSYIPFSAYQISVLTNTKTTTLIPIPLHISRFRFRGFNQSEVLGKLVASQLGIQYSVDVLGRDSATRPQVSMKHKSDRLTNMRHAFSLRTADTLIRAATVLLFDDVCTTGATLREAANVLKRHGTHTVWGVTIAR